jgi:predicted MFS family arabinose efflux permease
MMASDAATEERPAATAGDTQLRWTMAQIYILALLTLVNVANYLDRGVISILQEPMKHDLRLADWQLGVIGGPAFAIFYSVAGIPTARFAERLNRVTILSIALTLWSGMTALCGVVSNFSQLLLARLGVGAGEGACSPVSHSLVADTFGPRQRGMALAVLTTSIPCAHLMAPLIGAIAATAFGWRAAFIIVGLPGVVLAIVLRLTVKEPRHDRNNAIASHAPAGRFLDDLKLLLRNKAFVWLFIATTFMGQAVTSVNVFTASYFVRTFHLTIAQAGALIAVGVGLAGFAGTFVGGFFADRFAGEYGRSYLYVTGAAAGLAGIFFLVTFHLDSLPLAMPFLLAANLSSEMKNGPNYAAVQNLSPPHMRTTAAAIIMIAVVVLGGGIGPWLVGVVSDHGAAGHFPAALGHFAAMCPGGKPAAGGSAQLAAACADASAAGIRLGMLVPCVTYLLAAPCYFYSGRSIREKLAR